MDGWNFVDLATKAKELKISDNTLRARILSGSLECFIYVANVRAYAATEEWLPAYDSERFPLAEWIDHGSAFRREDDLEPRDGWPPNRTPWYHISGWVGLDRGIVEAVLTRGNCEFDYAPICVQDSEQTLICWLRVRTDDEKEWVDVGGSQYEEGGYWREKPVKLTRDDLFLLAAESDAPKTLTSRKEQSYLGIIAAMRALLRSEDGGGFPSEAKIIDQLVERYRAVNGVSKRNLESVFADATRAIDDLTSPK